MTVRLPKEVREELDRLQRHYQIDPNELERGYNGYVFFAKNAITGQEVAIKFYDVEADGKQHREPQLLAQIRSPNVLEVLDARHVTDGLAFFVTPRCNGGDLDDLIAQGVSAGGALEIVAGICQGVSAMHANRLVHRDLKPRNIVLDQGQPKIADFGSVRLLPEGADEVPASAHSLIYRAPESFTRGTHGKISDVYQVGIVAYQLLGGSLSYDARHYLKPKERRDVEQLLDPFDQQRLVDAAVQKRITSRSLLDMDSLPPWTRPVHRVIRRMTAPDPGARYQSIAEAATAMHSVRNRVADWRRTPTGAILTEKGRLVEVRETGTTGVYEAFIGTASGYRRARGAKGSLSEVIATIR